MAELRQEAPEQFDARLLRWSDQVCIVAHVLLQSNLWFVESPAHALEVRAYVEEGHGIWVKRAKNTFLFERYPEIWDQQGSTTMTTHPSE